jgi:hypothetical protein
MDFGQAVQQLRTSDGTSPAEAEVIGMRLLGLAVPGVAYGMKLAEKWQAAGVTDAELAEAAAAARVTPYSIDDWIAALRRIGRRPDREDLIRVIQELGSQGWNPDAAAFMLVGDEFTPGLLGLR